MSGLWKHFLWLGWVPRLRSFIRLLVESVLEFGFEKFTIIQFQDRIFQSQKHEE